MDNKPEPTNDHERMIAEALDGKLLDGPYESVVTDVVVSMPFDMSIADTQFLFNYAHWRQGHSVKKQPTREMPPEGLKRSG